MKHMLHAPGGSARLKGASRKTGSMDSTTTRLPEAVVFPDAPSRTEALTRTLHAFVRAVFAFQRRRARKLGLGAGRCGGIAVVQRFGSACELNVHFHTLVFDGVYVYEVTIDCPQFRPLPAPTAAELEGVTRAVARKTRCVLRRAGLLDDHVLADTAHAQPELAGLIAESVSFPKGRVVDPLRGLRASGTAVSTPSTSTLA